jgi:hypothetical protein
MGFARIAVTGMRNVGLGQDLEQRCLAHLRQADDSGFHERSGICCLFENFAAGFLLLAAGENAPVSRDMGTATISSSSWSIQTGKVCRRQKPVASR